MMLTDRIYLTRDLPGLRKGAIGDYSGALGEYMFTEGEILYSYTQAEVEANPKFFTTKNNRGFVQRIRDFFEDLDCYLKDYYQAWYD